MTPNIHFSGPHNLLEFKPGAQVKSLIAYVDIRYGIKGTIKSETQALVYSRLTTRNAFQALPPSTPLQTKSLSEHHLLDMAIISLTTTDIFQHSWGLKRKCRPYETSLLWKLPPGTHGKFKNHRGANLNNAAHAPLSSQSSPRTWFLSTWNEKHRIKSCTCPKLG